MRNIVDTLRREIPDHTFENIGNDLYIDGVRSGPLAEINKDINSYLALDSESEFVKMIKMEIEIRLRNETFDRR
jgi:hypothetical protein